MSFVNGSRIGDYEVIGPLGAGGMGQVYKVRNLISDRLEAMKVLLPDLASEPELADRFLREIKMQANLDHPNIAKLHTALRIDDQLIMFMEFLEGVSLDQRVRQGPIPPEQAVDYVGQVLSALDYAHQHGVIHRDIKPGNMMLTAGGAVKLMDFGIAKATAEHGLTGTGMTLGSLYYMSPEQIQGANVDPRSDLYSVGVSLYEMVTGKKPFDGTNQFSIMSAHLEKAPIPPSEIERDIPPALSDLILMSLSRDPASRFQTAGAFRNALQSWAPAVGRPAPAAALQMSPRPVAQTAGVSGPGARAAKPRSHRALWVAAGGLCAALAMVALIQFGPRKTISAKPPAVSSPPAATPPAQSPPQSPAAAQTAPAGVSTATTATSHPSHPTASHPVDTGRLSAQDLSPATQKPADQRDVTAVASQAAPPNSQTPPTSQPPPVSKEELQELHDRWTQLDGRAASIHSTLENLQSRQAARGISLRGDWLTDAQLMDTGLQQASSALSANDPVSAKRYLESAERQVETLEAALNK